MGTTLEQTLICRFNPRAREGRDAGITTGLVHMTSFNPRAREGRDQLPVLK